MKILSKNQDKLNLAYKHSYIIQLLKYDINLFQEELDSITLHAFI